MPGTQFGLDSAFQDLCDRYGPDDPTVLELQSELQQRKESISALPFEERRQPGSSRGFWSRQDAHPIPRLNGRERGYRVAGTWPEPHELPSDVHIGQFAGSLLPRSDWDHPV